MQLTFRSLRRFGLDFSNIDKRVTTTGLRNYKIEGKRDIEGYVSQNFNTKAKLHTVIMIHEWWGLNESITRTADIFSNKNIRVFVPDLYRDDAANDAEVLAHTHVGSRTQDAKPELGTGPLRHRVGQAPP